MLRPVTSSQLSGVCRLAGFAGAMADSSLPILDMHGSSSMGNGPAVGGSGPGGPEGLPNRDMDDPEGLPNLDMDDALAVGNGQANGGGNDAGLPNLDMDDSLTVGSGGIPAVGGWIEFDLPNLPDLDVQHELPYGGGMMMVSASNVEVEDELPVIDNGHVLPDVGGQAASFGVPAVGGQTGAHPAVGGKRSQKKRKALGEQLDVPRLASRDLCWRSLPYLRWKALDDICTVAKLYGHDLLGRSPDAEWLDVGKARNFVTSMHSRNWRHSLDEHGDLKPLCLEQPVDFLDIFSGCGNLTLAAARNGLRVGPSIDILRGAGHADSFTIDICQASDRRIVWALIALLSPRWTHMAFPCTFWIPIAHWTRTRDLDRNEQARLRALVFIIFSRQIVDYQASRRRHSSVENPPRSVAWDLDIMKAMIDMANMECVETNLCAWGARDPGSGLLYQKAMRFASTFNMKPLARTCPKSHAHQVVEGVVSRGPLKGRSRSAISGQYPMPLCHTWTSLAKSEILTI